MTADALSATHVTLGLRVYHGTGRAEKRAARTYARRQMFVQREGREERGEERGERGEGRGERGEGREGRGGDAK
jgi:hypothetical protein